MIIVEFSQAACITVNEPRTFHIGYLFLQEMCTELQLDKLCPVIRGRYKFKYDFHVVLRNTHYRMFRGHYLRSLGIYLSKDTGQRKKLCIQLYCMRKVRRYLRNIQKDTYMNFDREQTSTWI